MQWSTRRARKDLQRLGLSEDDIAQWLLLHQRERFAEAFLRDREGRPWSVRPYQRASLESYAPRKVHCDGRDVGKTTEIEVTAAWAMVMCPNTEMLVATQCENHLFPLMHRLVRRFEDTPEFAPSLVEIKRSPSWFLRFSNGFCLWGRIAGPRGMNFQGMHVDWQVVDEAQEMTETAWGELLQALNAGGRRWVYGVPNGLRNTFYRLTQMSDIEQYNWPSSLHPGYTPEKDAELAAMYGGRDAPGYIHRVLGQHGSPAHAVFNLDDYLACVDEGLACVEVELGSDDGFDAPSAAAGGPYYLGCDLGYARDPSELVVWQAQGPDFVHVLRARLLGVSYARQQEIITTLDAAYDFASIGIDCGNSGRAVAHNLMQQGARWCDKVTAFEFGGVTDVGCLPDGQPDRRRTKVFMTELLERRMAERTLVFPHSAEREQQYAGHTYSVRESGLIVYEKGNDHIIDADRCAVLAHYLDTREPFQTSLGVRVAGF
jgi:hypothetical protein